MRRVANESILQPREAAAKLFAYCYARDFAGYDPYDALNSKYLTTIPLLDRKPVRLLLTQAFKRSPISLRTFFRVPPTQNPKALALFLTASLKLLRLGIIDDEELPAKLSRRLLELRSADQRYWCWGYSFPWQTRTVLVPRGAPNVVCTIFVANALLDYIEEGYDEEGTLDVVASTCDYLVNELYYTEAGDVHSFCYPLPSTRTKVHNANFLAAALLARAFRHTGTVKHREVALQVAGYSASKQNSDGSWMYGEAPTQQWIDNFHTGYNLSGLRTLAESLNTSDFDKVIADGFAFYRAHFFREDGAVRYFHNRRYPIDIHCVAQSILTLIEFRHFDGSNLALARRVYDWAMRNMWNEAGFFHYRLLRTVKIRIPYMRWSEAWMLLALSSLAEVQELKSKQRNERTPAGALAET